VLALQQPAAESELAALLLAELDVADVLFELGLICRAEDKGEPVIQLSPPLVAGPEEFRGIARILRQALAESWDRIH